METTFAVLAVVGLTAYVLHNYFYSAQSKTLQEEGATPVTPGTQVPVQPGTQVPPVQDKVQQLAQAIAHAEGFYVSGSRPQRNNNPGDLKHWSAMYPTDADGYTIFPDLSSGWIALQRESSKIASGTAIATPYGLDSTWTDVGQVYSPSGWQDWADNVAYALGVDSTSTIREWINK